MDISMDISMDLSMDIHIHGKPASSTCLMWSYFLAPIVALPCSDFRTDCRWSSCYVESRPTPNGLFSSQFLEIMNPLALSNPLLSRPSVVLAPVFDHTRIIKYHTFNTCVLLKIQNTRMIRVLLYRSALGRKDTVHTELKNRSQVK